MAPERDGSRTPDLDPIEEHTEAPSSSPRGKPGFTQDPHRVRELAERNLETAIGREVRAFRRAQGMTVADLRAPAPADCTTSVALGLDAPKFWNLIVDALERIGDPA